MVPAFVVCIYTCHLKGNFRPFCFFSRFFASGCYRRPFRDSEVDAAAEITPALLVLNKMVVASEDSRMAVKRAIFPPEADEVGGDE